MRAHPGDTPSLETLLPMQQRGSDLGSPESVWQRTLAMLAQALALQSQSREEQQRLQTENRHLQEALQSRYGFGNLIGQSNQMRPVYAQIARLAAGLEPALIRGEPGTGKTRIAQTIHYNSPRAQGPFIQMHCAALPETVLAAELFGHEPGAYPGAQTLKRGYLELAAAGTLFVDDLGALSPALQHRLLRALQEQTFVRLGGTTSRPSSARLLLATSGDVEAALRQRQGCEDLYACLASRTIYVPALRERRADILVLAEHFIDTYAHMHGKRIKRLATSASDMLLHYHWPGNVRELEHALERAVLLCEGQVLHGYHLPMSLQTAESSGTVPAISLTEAVEALERQMIQDALHFTRGNRAQAAKLLGTTERILGYKVRKYAINCKRFRVR
ncbi:MAG: sigma 54-interacting transcriptional regulator [Candidatus Tectimicrobiota bacterium]